MARPQRLPARRRSHLPHLFHRRPCRRTDGRHLELSLGRQEVWEDSPEGYPQTPTYKWWNWNDSYVTEAEPDKGWVAISDAGEEAMRAKATSAKS
jgi:hypothetical protein